MEPANDNGIVEVRMSQADWRKRVIYLHSRKARKDALKRRWMRKGRIGYWSFFFGAVAGFTLFLAVSVYAFAN